MGYKEVYSAWQADPEGFWMDAAKGIDWVQSPSKAYFEQGPAGEWFADAMVNTCFNAVDRHVLAGRGDQIAIMHESPITHSTKGITYKELQARVSSLAGALRMRGVEKGDRVIIYMPMIPEALEAMLACARLGAIHSVVFGGFAAHELAVRIDDCTPKAIIAASCGLEPGRVVHYKPLLDAAIEQASHKPEFCVVFQREQEVAKLVEGRDFSWHGFQYGVKPAECVPVEGNHPAYILYTSGTTGAPKGVVRPTAGHLVALNWSMKAIYNIEAGDRFWAASDVGWVVGHSYICYAPLLAGATTVVFEGKPVGTPHPGVFWRIIQNHRIKSFFTAPTALRAIRREDPNGEYIKRYKLHEMQALFLAGERADPETVKWAQEHLGVPVIDHWWQTETGWAIAGNPLGIELLPVKVGSPTKPMPGYDVQVLDEGGHPVAPGTLGAIAIKLPLPPGTLPTLWNADDRFKKSYLSHFPGYYETGDAGYIDEDGYVYIMARTDDVINVAGHRLSTGAMEEVLASHKDVAECAVIGVADELKGQLPMGFLCLTKGCTRPHAEVIKECVRLVRDQIGPVAAFKLAVVVDRLPKTRSGKILRGTMAKIADGLEYKMPATIDDPAILDEISAALTAIGYPEKAA
ncbi:propionyl-CoA synthetase [Rhodobacter capsulatus]|jgi:propionyl-CoA synthetase|uniref:Propionate--CoA ligase n=1 Tax=Rhodobacter capsulatus (strain ATCC BAA-309 / NBRC 16581 / SB1003) TaxID=272942 RepID=D5AMR8_RHOCB|nr:propionyl-CoA synthetase [Rhodobacter capsulatus]ADE84207.1 propionate--CoA ligase [Rhodobacter capsulatus SB 1003]ETD02945.1 acyl-CoA synthetase [Rhodobacter capsulatus DE442]ETD79576.1 acyl-CoA synthetase [Rhodobacter capsulatus R121]ETD83636.1 acyl-CoA synthetase [Rhodobacter capsulatus YW1]ETE55004.1 acyl-CoA synthetase [Rhodobacter capsulatus Y262]